MICVAGRTRYNVYTNLMPHPAVTLRINPQSPIPIYYQIREQLRQRILSGSLKPGDPLPTEGQICCECGVSRMTARQALSQLASEGLIVRRRGRGSFVAPPKATIRQDAPALLSYTAFVGQLGLQAGASVRRQHVVMASGQAAAQLQLAEGEPVIEIVRVRLIGGEAMSLETSHLPQRLFPTLAHIDLTDRSLYRVLEEIFGITPTHALDTIELASAGELEAQELGLRPGVPVVFSTRLTYTSQDVPIVFTQTVHRGDRFRSVVRCARQELVDL